MHKLVILLGLLGAANLASAKDTNSNQKGQHGVSMLMPGGFNYVYKGNKLQFAGGMTGGDTYGVEVGYRMPRKTQSAFRSTNVVLGYFRIETADDCFNCIPYEEWSYIGVSATFQANLFYIEPGLSVGSGDFSNPQFILQMGLLFN